jgi:hypothetical protein
MNIQGLLKLVRTEAEIRDSLIDRATSESGFIDDFQDRGRLDILFSIIGAEFSAFEALMEEELLETNIVTATSRENIEKLATPFYLPITPTYYENIALLTRDGTVNGDIMIPLGTIFETSSTNPIQYITTQEKWLYDGQNQIRLRVRAMNAGSASQIETGELNVVTNNSVAGITVTNPYVSWGGRDADSDSDIKRAVMAARYEFESGLKNAIENELREYGLAYYRYNLEEFAYGEGSGALYIDVTSDEELADIRVYVERKIGWGIYHRFEKAVPLEFDFSFTVNISSEHDILPNIRDSLKKDVEQIFTDYVDQIGVGKPIIISKATNWLYDQLLDTYELYDITINTEDYSNKRDSYGNLIFEPNEVAKVTNVSVDIYAG